MPTLATADDVLGSVKRFADGSGLATLLTGGWHHERPPASATMPWAVAKCEETETIRHTLGECRTYRVSIEVRSQEGLSDRRAIARELMSLDRFQGLTLPGTDSRVIHCLRVPGKLTEEQQQHQARDVALTLDVFDVLVGHPAQDHAVGIGAASTLIGTGSTGIGVSL